MILTFEALPHSRNRQDSECGLSCAPICVPSACFCISFLNMELRTRGHLAETLTTGDVPPSHHIKNCDLEKACQTKQKATVSHFSDSKEVSCSSDSSLLITPPSSLTCLWASKLVLTSRQNFSSQVSMVNQCLTKSAPGLTELVRDSQM